MVIVPRGVAHVLAWAPACAATSPPSCVESLAEVAMQPRSAFSERFRELMGEAPMGYVRRWRLYHVRILLRSTDLSLDEIAKRTGYGSAAALSVTFVREGGTVAWPVPEAAGAPGGLRWTLPPPRGCGRARWSHAMEGGPFQVAASRRGGHIAQVGSRGGEAAR